MLVKCQKYHFAIVEKIKRLNPFKHVQTVVYSAPFYPFLMIRENVSRACLHFWAGVSSLALAPLKRLLLCEAAVFQVFRTDKANANNRIDIFL